MCLTGAPEAAGPAGAQAPGGPDRQLLAGVGALARDLALASTRADVLGTLCTRISTIVTAPTAYVALNQVRADEAVVCLRGSGERVRLDELVAGDQVYAAAE
jgi:hypothetical protein